MTSAMGICPVVSLVWGLVILPAYRARITLVSLTRHLVTWYRAGVRPQFISYTKFQLTILGSLSVIRIYVC